MDEHKILHRLQYLSHYLFVENEQGKEFIRLMKVLHVMTPTFPQKPELIEAHGGSLAWSAFREGQVTQLRAIDRMAQEYVVKIESERLQDERAKA